MKNWFWWLLCCMPLWLQAQHTEFGIHIGISNYSGDLDPDVKSRILRESNLAGGILVRYPLGTFVAVRGTLSAGTLSGKDSNNENNARKSRNLSFRNRFQELALTAEWNILGFDGYDKKFTPYVFGGGAVFHHNPQTSYKGEWVNLQPLGTEGQGMPNRPEKYKLWQFSIPFGGGIKYAINESFTVGAELGFRKTFTDYIDDASTIYIAYNELAQANGELAARLSDRSNEFLGSNEPTNVTTGTARASAKYKDFYGLLSLTATYSFGTDNGLSSGGGHFRVRRNSGCPTF